MKILFVKRERTVYSHYVSEKREREVLALELPCPMSGFRLTDGQVIPLHLAEVVTCRGTMLMVHCPIHVFRGFLCDRKTVQLVRDVEVGLKTKK